MTIKVAGLLFPYIWPIKLEALSLGKVVYIFFGIDNSFSEERCSVSSLSKYLSLYSCSETLICETLMHYSMLFSNYFIQYTSV